MKKKIIYFFVTVMVFQLFIVGTSKCVLASEMTVDAGIEFTKNQSEVSENKTGSLPQTSEKLTSLAASLSGLGVLVIATSLYARKEGKT